MSSLPPVFPPVSSQSLTRRGARVGKAGAFTLTELLVVITIVGILTAILIPVISSMKRSAESLTCQSNLRQVFNLYMLSVQENHGQLPPYHDPVTGKTLIWIQGLAVQEYAGADSQAMEQILGCPVQIALKGAPLLATSKKNSRAPCTYAINNQNLISSVESPGTEYRKTLASIQQPARVALGGDGNDSDGAPDYYGGVIGVGRPPQACHNGKANIVFLDGHVEAVGNQSLLNVQSTPKPGTPQAAFWYGE